MAFHIPSLTLPAQVFSQPALSILLPVTLGTGVGFSVSSKETEQTYLALKQPPYRPPPYVFGPAWTVLYGLMGFSAYRAWTTGMSSLDTVKVDMTKHGATIYTIQLGLNLAWMPLFFKFKRPIEATVDAVALTGLTGYLTYVWGQVDHVAGWALTPYLGWLLFATYLSAGAGYLNGWNFSGRKASASAKGKKAKNVDETV